MKGVPARGTRLNRELVKLLGSEALLCDTRLTEQSDTDRTVVARSFVVRDGQGQRRAELGAVIPEGQTEENPLVPGFEE